MENCTLELIVLLGFKGFPIFKYDLKSNNVPNSGKINRSIEVSTWIGKNTNSNSPSSGKIFSQKFYLPVLL